MTETLSAQYLANEDGYFGEFGGAPLPPHLVGPIAEVAAAYQEAQADPAFVQELQDLLSAYVGRPSLLYYAQNLTRELGGAKIYLKREDLNHTGAHKINHCLGKALLAKRMGKKTLIAETGAGQHGVAFATAAALVGLNCEIHMGAIDVEKQHAKVAYLTTSWPALVEAPTLWDCSLRSLKMKLWRSKALNPQEKAWKEPGTPQP